MLQTRSWVPNLFMWQLHYMLNNFCIQRLGGKVPRGSSIHRAWGCPHPLWTSLKCTTSNPLNLNINLQLIFINGELHSILQSSGVAHIISLKPLFGTGIHWIMEWSTHTYEGEDGQEQECCRIIQSIIKLYFRRFDNMYIFDIRWFKDIMLKVPQFFVNVEPSGFRTIDSTWICSV
jgi:hypothetical protein